MSKEFNIHHIVFKNDKKTGLVPSSFSLNFESNKVKLPIGVHNELHAIVDSNPIFKKDVSTRVYLANMAYNGELDMIPENFYRVNPVELQKSNRR